MSGMTPECGQSWHLPIWEPGQTSEIVDINVPEQVAYFANGWRASLCVDWEEAGAVMVQEEEE